MCSLRFFFRFFDSKLHDTIELKPIFPEKLNTKDNLFTLHHCFIKKKKKKKFHKRLFEMCESNLFSLRAVCNTAGRSVHVFMLCGAALNHLAISPTSRRCLTEQDVGTRENGCYQPLHFCQFNNSRTLI